MCLNRNTPQITICPGSSRLHPEPTPCRFVKSYIDKRGWKYKVIVGLGTPPVYKARYQRSDKHGDVGWKGCAALPWRDTFDEAQSDLNTYAKLKGWEEWNR
jgi:hypothetical protein